jgi:phosphoribosylformylglycinamidine (FGAM) synthase-like enzyme
MWVVKVGGPAYRIGLGGGAASSRVGDAGTANLDFDAVQVLLEQCAYQSIQHCTLAL